MISVELIKKKGRCDDLCNFCVNETADFRIRYGSTYNNKAVISLCRRCEQELLKILRRAEKSGLSDM